MFKNYHQGKVCPFRFHIIFFDIMRTVWWYLSHSISYMWRFMELNLRSLYRPHTLVNQVFHDKEIWCISVRLSDHYSNALPTKLGRNLLGSRFLKWSLFVSCTTSHYALYSFLESIEHDFLKALMIHRDNQVVICSIGGALEWWSEGC